MGIDRRLKEILRTIATTKPNEYAGESDAYITFNYNSVPSDFGDDEPGHEVFSIQVHLFCPSGMNSLSMRRQIKRALVAAGFTWPMYINASDRDGQHHVFECQTAQQAGVE